MKFFAAACAAALALSASGAACAAAVDPTPYVRPDSFDTLKISPNGDYYAATVPMEDRKVLVILRAADRTISAGITLGRNTEVHDIWWVNPERVMISVAEKFGSNDEPWLTGELAAVNVDGSRPEWLVGFRAIEKTVGTRISSKKGDKVAAFVIDDLPRDDRQVLIATQPFTDDAFFKIERMDVYTGKRRTIGRAPVRNAEFSTDNDGVVRFAEGYDVDRVHQLFHRENDKAEWTAVDSPAGTLEHPKGFSPDNRLAYLRQQRATGPDAIVEYDIAKGTRRIVLEDDDTDPYALVMRTASQTPVGAEFYDGARRVAFFDDAAPEARLHRSLSAAFKGSQVRITSTSTDGRLALVQVWSDRNPGDFYVFDTQAKKADYLVSRRDWLDPEAMATVRPFALKARDGIALHGYLTVPHGSDGKQLPMVVMPHGGPFQIFDRGDFEPIAQWLAAAGYAVLQVNFRGSGNHGYAFEHAGQREWGGAIQNDITDATRWAIAEGIADAARICIHGGSFGGYAAMMGAAREPELYQCASGYVGVYDLPKMHTHGDIQQRGSGETYVKEWIGPAETLASVSPVNLADRIKVPVLLAAGGEDLRAPMIHTKRMEEALQKADVPVQAIYYATEGHGFYDLAHLTEYYGKLLAFFDSHIGKKN
jgi:dipeptidyl aminopeptidase/acylaminoacyl peptidase